MGQSFSDKPLGSVVGVSMNTLHFFQNLVIERLWVVKRLIMHVSSRIRPFEIKAAG